MTRFGERSRVTTAISDWGFPTGDTALYPVTVNFLVLAGGAGGAYQYGGSGGGAGGLRSSVTATGGGGTLESALLINLNQNYTVTVGAGGTANSGGGFSGNNSVFSTITSHGGGGTSYGNGGGAAGGPSATTSTGATRTYSDEGFSGGNFASEYVTQNFLVVAVVAVLVQ